MVSAFQKIISIWLDSKETSWLGLERDGGCGWTKEGLLICFQMEAKPGMGEPLEGN